MNKIKYLFLGLLAMCTTAVFTSCDDDDQEPTIQYIEKEVIKEVEKEVPVPSSNWERYQELVTKDVKSKKQHDKAILLVAFGSTWQQAFDAFDTTIEAYKAEFKDYDVFLSYSSAICINRAAAGENAADGAEIRNYYAPPFWLNAFAAEGVRYKEIVVQSLQVIPGEEYTRICRRLN